MIMVGNKVKHLNNNNMHSLGVLSKDFDYNKFTHKYKKDKKWQQAIVWQHYTQIGETFTKNLL